MSLLYVFNGGCGRSASVGICYHCGKETELPYRCRYCNLMFCDEHRLPEQHNCAKEPGRNWSNYKRVRNSRESFGKENIFSKLRKKLRK